MHAQALGAYPPKQGGWVWRGRRRVPPRRVLTGRLSRRGTGLVKILNEVLAAVGRKSGQPAVQCESQVPPDLLE